MNTPPSATCEPRPAQVMAAPRASRSPAEVPFPFSEIERSLPESRYPDPPGDASPDRPLTQAQSAAIGLAYDDTIFTASARALDGGSEFQQEALARSDGGGMGRSCSTQRRATRSCRSRSPKARAFERLSPCRSSGRAKPDSIRPQPTTMSAPTEAVS